MLFNSPQFIFLFFPVVFIGYFVISTFVSRIGSRVWLVGCSLFFYSMWNTKYIPLILFSIFLNYIVGRLLIQRPRKFLLVIGIISNLSLLGYYKYLDFIIQNVNQMFAFHIPLLNLALPLAISFYTFQQISYLVDCYRGKVDNYSLVNYLLFITFFPHLIAGPIVHHRVMMPQFQSVSNVKINYHNIALGFFCFSIGLFKKVILADRLSLTVADGLGNLSTLSFFDAWTVILSYTFQLYFDFSGYSDMAIGLALFFNIKLPINFNSPYKASDFQDMVSRWHITLTRFLYEYVYVPMIRYLSQKARRGFRINWSTSVKTSFNVMLLMLLSGIWHGAGWNFMIWGLLMGGGIIVHRLWSKLGVKLPIILGWGITFCYINIILVFFRTESLEQAATFLEALLGLNGFILPQQLQEPLNTLTEFGIRFESTPLQNKYKALGYVVLSLIIVLGFKNTAEKMEKFKPSYPMLIFVVLILFYSILHLTQVSEFLYFNF